MLELAKSEEEIITPDPLHRIKLARLVNGAFIIRVKGSRPESRIPGPEIAREQNAGLKKLKKIIGIVEENFSDHTFNVEQLCKLLFMSRSQLTRKLKILTGSSPNNYIRAIRLKKAKQLLCTSNLSISTISVLSGYEDPSYFTRIFKKESGNTPLEWRHSNQHSFI